MTFVKDSWARIPKFNKSLDEIISTCYFNAKNLYMIPISNIIWDNSKIYTVSLLNWNVKLKLLRTQDEMISPIIPD